MEKLEAKHFIVYLNHELEFVAADHNQQDIVLTTIGMVSQMAVGIDMEQSYNYEMDEIKPLLYPLPDLYDEIANYIYSVDGESFDSLEDARTWIEIMLNEPLGIPYRVFDKIASLHGDLFGLIESGLAFNKNDYVQG